MNETNTRDALIYCRRSSDPKGTGRSVASQERENRVVCEREGWRVLEVVTDNHRSASRYATRARAGYDRIAELVASGRVHVIVAWEASRLQRDLAAYVQIRDLCIAHGVLWNYKGRSFDLSRPDDRFASGLDALIAEREADDSRERTMRGMRDSAAKGRPHGSAPYGYDRQYNERTGELDRQVINEAEAAVVRELARRVLSGESWRAILTDLHARDIRPRRAKEWNTHTLRRMLANPAYIGRVVYQGQDFGPGDWPPILTREEHFALKRLLADPERQRYRRGAARHLLSSLVVCDVCSQPLRVHPSKRRATRYSCPSSHTSAQQRHLDAFIASTDLPHGLILRRLARPDVAELLATENHDEEAAAAAAEAEELRAKLEEHTDSAAAPGGISAVALARIEAQLLPKIEDADRRAAAARVSPALRGVAQPGDIDKVVDVWQALSVAQRKEVIAALAEIRLRPAIPGRQYFDPDERLVINWRQQ